MIVVNIDDIPDNAVLARDVRNESGVVLLGKGYTITPDIVDKLIENDIHSVWIKVLGKEVDTFSTETIQNDIFESISQAIESRIRFKDENEIKMISEKTYAIIRQIIQDENVMNCMINVKRKTEDIYSHMINVAVLSIVMGIKIGIPEKGLIDIGKGSLFHDIGLCDMEIEYRNVEVDKLSSKDKMIYRRHVIEGYEVIHKYDWISEMVKLIVLSHHERDDGSGYPFHKKSDRIPLEVKIVGVCDYFDEMINGIGFERKKVHEVVEYLRTVGAYLFDFDVVTKIISNIAWFPNGSKVIINDGDMAEVISQNKGLPDRPIIRLIKDADGNYYEEKIIKDLTEHLTVFIIDTVE